MTFEFVTTTLALPDPNLIQSADGNGYFAYYSESYSFCWRGEEGEPVEVSFGGAGEPYQWLIGIVGTLPATPKEFAALCEQWLAVPIEGAECGMCGREDNLIHVESGIFLCEFHAANRA